MGELHNLDVGCADTSVLISEDNTFIIDCQDAIRNYSYLLPSDKYITGLFITHQHYDHFDGLKYFRENGYRIGHLIHSPYKRRNGDNSVPLDEWNDFKSHLDYFRTNGTAIYSPYRQDDVSKPYWSICGLEFRIIGPYKEIADSETRELHDACLVIHVKMGSRICTFTGDSSDKNLNKIALNTTNYCNDILHASHHGSIKGADLDFIKNANPRYTVISTQSGVHESVPHQTALDRYRRHTSDIVYRTDIDHSLKWTF